MRTIVTLPLILVLSLSAQCVYALDKPPQKLLKQQLTSVIPPYWTVTATFITASVNTGDAVEPNIKQRFKATVAPKSQLFVEDPGSAKALAPYIPLVRSVGTKKTRTLYGIARSTYSAGQWNTKLDMENSVAKLGQPRSLFSGPTVVRGSKRETNLKNLLVEDIAQEVTRRSQAKIKAKKAAYDFKLQQLKTQQAQSVDKIKAQQAQLVDQIKARYAKQMHDLKRQKQKVAALEADQEAEIAHVKKAHKTAMKNLAAEHQAELKQAKQKFATALDALKQAHQQKMKRINTQYNQKVERLQAEIKQTSKLAALQDQKAQKETKLAAARQKVLDGRTRHNKKLLADFRKAVAAKNGDARRAAFTAAMNSDNALLSRTALRAGIKSDDPVLQATSIRLGLQSDKSAIQQAALAAGLSSQDSALRSATFKAGLESDDPAFQATAIRLGLNSDDPSVQKRAIQAGLKTKGSELRSAAIKAGVASKDNVIRNTAIKAGLTSDNVGQRSVVLSNTLKSKDPQVQHMGLAYIFSHRKSFGVIVSPAKKPNAKRDSITINLSDVNEKTGDLTGNVGGKFGSHRFACSRTLTGTLSGSHLTMTSKYCEINVQLSDRRTMKGSVAETYYSNDHYMATLHLMD